MSKQMLSEHVPVKLFNALTHQDGDTLDHTSEGEGQEDLESLAVEVDTLNAIAGMSGTTTFNNNTGTFTFVPATHNGYTVAATNATWGANKRLYLGSMAAGNSFTLLTFAPFEPLVAVDLGSLAWGAVFESGTKLSGRITFLQYGGKIYV
jgi:hypothetical protein